MHIEDVYLKKFRVYDNLNIKFNNSLNIIYGDNATGKTSILEAIFIASLGKSFRTNKDKEVIKLGEKDAQIEVNAEKKDRKINIKIQIDDKKKIYNNNILLKKTSDILGKNYIVLFTPDDINILNNEPGKRRRFLNIMISQLRPNYVYLINQYNKILEQRNFYLKQIKYENKNEEILDIWDEQLYNAGIRIYNYRKEFIEKINFKIKEIHLKTTNNKEKIELKYITNVNENLLNKIKENRKIDINKGYTTIGIHRDDFETYINEKKISIFGSQGQKRTAIISLKLAEAQVIEEEIEEKPIILLDDFMSELDNKRIQGLFENIKDNQVIITCTDKLVINSLEYNLYNVKNGQVEKIK